MQTPMGVEKDRICFSWKMCAKKKCVEQEAYQISLKCTGEEIWNSGKVISTHSVGIALGKISLKVGTRYTWQVTVWTKNSYNHFSYGTVAEWMHRYMAGISSEDCFKKCIIYLINIILCDKIKKYILKNT